MRKKYNFKNDTIFKLVGMNVSIDSFLEKNNTSIDDLGYDSIDNICELFLVTRNNEYFTYGLIGYTDDCPSGYTLANYVNRYWERTTEKKCIFNLSEPLLELTYENIESEDNILFEVVYGDDPYYPTDYFEVKQNIYNFINNLNTRINTT